MTAQWRDMVIEVVIKFATLAITIISRIPVGSSMCDITFWDTSRGGGYGSVIELTSIMAVSIFMRTMHVEVTN